VPVQRCTVHKHRNLLAHAPDRRHRAQQPILTAQFENRDNRCEFRFNPARDSDLMSAAVPI
jgi:transposase-like protein